MNIKEYWHIEVVGGKHKKFSWQRLIKAYFKSHKSQFLFEFRLAQFLYFKYGNVFFVKYLKKRINKRYPVDIPVECTIGKGLYIPHLVGVVITSRAKIGENFTVFQNVTVGQKDDQALIVIGDNVTIGANSCVIGSDMVIEDNVEIGAFSFLNKSLSKNTLYYMRYESNTLVKKEGEEYISSRNTRSRNRNR